jgi:hypothetical protein
MDIAKVIVMTLQQGNSPYFEHPGLIEIENFYLRNNDTRPQAVLILGMG